MAEPLTSPESNMSLNPWRLTLASFYSADTYRQVYWEWKSTGIAYLLLVVALAWIWPVVRVHQQYAEWAAGDAAFFAGQLPKISIRNGAASTEVETPYLIKDRHGNLTGLIDLTGEPVSLEDSDARILLTRRHLSIRKSEREVRTFALAEVSNTDVDRARVLHWLERGKAMVAPAFYVFGVFFAWLYRLCQALLYSLVAVGITGHLKQPYLRAFRLTAVALTPVIFINLAVEMAKVNVPVWWLICFFIAMAYIIFAARAASKGQPPVL